MDPQYSIELCGGSHIGHTGEIGFFKIKHESAVAAGVRRIEAVSGKAAENLINNQSKELKSINELLKNPKDLLKGIENIQLENNTLAKRIESLEARQLLGIRNEILQKEHIINHINFIGEIVEVSSADTLKKLCFDLKNQLKNHLIVLCTHIGGKAHVAVGVSENLITEKNVDASKIIKEIVGPAINGGGGGQKTLATAGGQEAGNFEQIITSVKSLL
jgi:alanyl-tRNA synthetase